MPSAKTSGSAIEGRARDLFRRHVAERAEHDARTGEGGRRRVRVRLDRVAWGGHGAGEAEVEQLDLTGGRHEDVFRLEVAMDDALVVRGRQSEGHLRAEIDDAPDRQAAVGELVAQRPAFEQLHGRVGHAVVAAVAVDREDVRVRERRDRARFLLEALAALGSAAATSPRTLIATSRPSVTSRAR